MTGRGQTGGHLSDAHQEMQTQVPADSVTPPHSPKGASSCSVPVPVHLTDANHEHTFRRRSHLPPAEKLPCSRSAPGSSGCTHWSLGQVFKARAVKGGREGCRSRTGRAPAAARAAPGTAAPRRRP